ncbi:hypothetical protein YWIDRAFT_02912 [Streptomyces sp. SceaMP-e96]|nr:hypothetical protein YWIDRAFT_02912 [Streptomyces sp. SceaMP-e96]
MTGDRQRGDNLGHCPQAVAAPKDRWGDPDWGYVHVIATGSDPQYAAIKRAVLTKVADTMDCR